MCLLCFAIQWFDIFELLQHLKLDEYMFSFQFQILCLFSLNLFNLIFYRIFVSLRSNFTDNKHTRYLLSHSASLKSLFHAFNVVFQYFFNLKISYREKTQDIHAGVNCGCLRSNFVCTRSDKLKKSKSSKINLFAVIFH